MKVIYIPSDKKTVFDTFRNQRHTNLTPGKIYDVINHFVIEDGTREVYLIFDDKGGSHFFNDDILIPLEKYRESKLNQLGI